MEKIIIKKILVLFTCLFVFGLSYNSYAIVLTFEDTTEHPLDTYGGVDWYGFGRYSIDSPVIKKGVVSGTHGAYSLIAGVYVDVFALPGERLNFQGVNLTGHFSDNYEIQVDGFLNGELVYTTTVYADYETPTWFSFNYTNIDRIGFIGKNSGPFLMDDFTFTKELAPPDPVPEPTTILLLGSGLISITGVRKKLRKR